MSSEKICNELSGFSHSSGKVNNVQRSNKMLMQKYLNQQEILILQYVKIMQYFIFIRILIIIFH